LRIQRPDGEKAAEVSQAYVLADGKAGAFALRMATERRIEQGLEYLAEFGYEKSKRSSHIFASWVVEDVVKEEVLDIEKEGLGECTGWTVDQEECQEPCFCMVQGRAGRKA